MKGKNKTKSSQILTSAGINHMFAGNQVSLIMLFEYHNETAKQFTGKSISTECYNQYNSTLEYLAGFIFHEYHREDISLSGISSKFTSGFRKYLATEMLLTQDKVLLYMGCLEKVLFIALATGLSGFPVILS